jgi:hypothetical protein
MITAFELAGFFAAHAIWCVSDGETLIPMLGFTTEDGQRQLQRLVSEDLPKSVGMGQEQLASNAMNANDAAFLYDARITLGERKLDAILIEIRAYFSPRSVAVLAVPYTPKGDAAFRVHKPKLLEWKECDDFDPELAFAAFFRGVDAHEEGKKIWDAALDQSI